MLVQRSSILIALCALFAVAGCDGGGGGGEGGDDTNTNNDDDTSTGPATECPPEQPDEDDACQPGLACSYMRDSTKCGGAQVETKAFCEEDGWRFLRQVACAPLPEGSCDPVGIWDVSETGPFEPTSGPDGPPNYSGPFKLHLTLEDNNIVYIEHYGGSLSEDGCELSVSRELYHSCSEVEGQSFCTTDYQYVDLSFSTTPATGTVNYQCEGECGVNTTAPIEATKQP